MCTYYSQLKKKKLIGATPNGPQHIVTAMVPIMSQNCTSIAEKISQNVLKVEA